MDFFYPSNCNLNPQSPLSSTSSPGSYESSNFNPQADTQFNLEDFLLDDWSTQPPSSSLSNLSNTANLNSDHLSCQSLNVLSESDSDSGLGISSSSNSPKTLTNENLIDPNQLEFLFSHNDLSNPSDQSTILQSCFSNENDLSSMLTYDQVDHNQSQTIDFSNILFNDQSQSNGLLDADTEALLNSIESVLNKYQQEGEAQRPQTRTKKANKNFVKDEPINQTNKSSGGLKKISPKLSNNQLPVLTVPSPEKLSNQAKLLNSNNNQTIILRDFNQIQNSNDLIQLLNAKIIAKPQPQILNIVKPNQQQPLTVLTTVPAVNYAANSIPIILADKNSITVQNNVSDSPNPKRLRQENLQGISSPVEKKSPAKQVVQLQVAQPAPTTLILTQNQGFDALNDSNLTQSLTSLNSSQLDPNLLKKQSRMIKNRESACLSRKRKKEYMQTLEDNLKEISDKNDQLTKENQELKDKVKSLEAENKLLKQSQQIKLVESTSANMLINKPKIQFTTLKTMPILSAKPLNTNTSLKRPFVMLAIFFVFGLNIIQFVNLNGGAQNSIAMSPLQIDSVDQHFSFNKETAQLTALAAANARDGALVDTSVLLKQQQIHLNSRHLLSKPDEFSNFDDNDSQQEKIKNSSKNSNATNTSGSKSYNLTKKSNESMELVMINGTWHLIDLNVCYKMMLSETNPNQFYNQTHVKKVNNELNGWFERYSSINSNNNQQKAHQKPEYSSSSSLLRNLNRNSNQQETKPVKLGILPMRSYKKKSLNMNKESTKEESMHPKNKQVYPVSLYDTQNRKHESFANSVRQRNDTFYYVSFRRDHVMYPALVQNKTQRPKMSLIVPALTTRLNGSNNTSNGNQQQHVAFMQIDCEVLDTRLFYLNVNDIPLDYMKILHQDFLMNQPEADS